MERAAEAAPYLIRFLLALVLVPDVQEYQPAHDEQDEPNSDYHFRFHRLFLAFSGFRVSFLFSDDEECGKPAREEQRRTDVGV